MRNKKFLDHKECQQFAVEFIRLAPKHHGILVFQMTDTRFSKTALVDMLKNFKTMNPDLFINEFGHVLSKRLDEIKYKSIDEICRFGDDLNCKVRK